MKKALAAILIFIMISNVCYASAENDYRAVFELTSLGIIEEKDGAIVPSRTVSRGEFTKVLIRLSSMDGSVGDYGFEFGDVSGDNEYAPYISAALGLGYVSMNAERLFHPENGISCCEAVTMVIRMLGYECIAQSHGGYPGGYVNTAVTYGLIDNVKNFYAEQAEYIDIINILYNAVDCRLMKQSYDGKGNFSFSDETLRDRLYHTEDSGKIEGIVTATSDIWLREPTSDMKDSQIEINGKMYDSDIYIDTMDYIGRKIEAFCIEKNGTETIVNITKSRKNTETKVDTHDVDKITASYIEFGRNHKTKIDFDIDTDFIYNGRILTSFTEDDLIAVNGSYLLVDNDGDKTCDYVFIEEYESAIVDRTGRNDTVFFKRGFECFGSSSITVDDDDDFTHTVLIDGEGKKITVNDIAEDSVISVVESKDKSFVKVIAGGQKPEGIMSARDEDTVTIDNTDFNLYTGCVFDDVRLGDYVSAYINFNDEIIKLECGTDENYGYVLASEVKGINKTRMKIIKCGAVEFKTEFDKSDVEKENEIPVVICKNEDVFICEVSDRVKLNGQTVGKSQAGNITEGSLITYKLDKNGMISNITTLMPEGGSRSMKIDFNAKDKTFGGIAGVTPFGIDKDTKVICLPTSENPSDDDILLNVKIDNRDSSVRYIASGYKIDEDDLNAGLLFIVQDMNAENISNITRYSDIGIITKVKHNSGDYGDVISVEMMCAGKKAEYNVSDIFAADKVDELQKGAFILFEKNDNDEIINASVISNLTGNMQHISQNRGNVNESITGSVQSVDIKRIDNEKNRRVHIVDLIADGVVTRVEIPARNAPYTYLYHTDGSGIEVISPMDITAGDVLCVAEPLGNIRDCVIIR